MSPSTGSSHVRRHARSSATKETTLHGQRTSPVGPVHPRPLRPGLGAAPLGPQTRRQRGQARQEASHGRRSPQAGRHAAQHVAQPQTVPTLPTTGHGNTHRGLTVHRIRPHTGKAKQVLPKKIPSRVRVTALSGLALRGRALDSSPNSSSSDTNRHRVDSNPQRVRIEVRDESKNTNEKQQQKQKRQ